VADHIRACSNEKLPTRKPHIKMTRVFLRTNHTCARKRSIQHMNTYIKEIRS